MICEIGKTEYPLPADFFSLYDHPHLETARRDQPDFYTIMLLRLSPAEMDKLRKDAARKSPEVPHARPHYYALIGGDRCVVFPPPDKEYTIHLRYFTQPRLW